MTGALIIRNARVLQPDGRVSKLSLRIEQGVIQEHLAAECQVHDRRRVLDAKGAWLLPGLFDAWCYSGFPDHPERESKESLVDAAWAGGFQTLLCAPSRSVRPDCGSSVRELLRLSKTGSKTSVGVWGCVTERSGSESRAPESKSMSPVDEILQAGAVGVTDMLEPLADTAMWRRLGDYVRECGGVLGMWVYEPYLDQHAVAHEGALASKLGLRASPSIAEALVVERACQIAALTEAPIHLHMISTALAVEKIRVAKKAGLSLSAGVSMAHLLESEEKIASYDGLWKYWPPLRSEADRSALCQGVFDGSLDTIVTAHKSCTHLDKHRSFDDAIHGQTMLQTGLSALHQRFAHEPEHWSAVVDALSQRPKKVFGSGASSGRLGKADVSSFAKSKPWYSVGHRADCILFDPEQAWRLNAESNRSKGRNSAYWEQTVQGRVTAHVFEGKEYSLVV